MNHIFSTCDAQKILKNKYVLILGDSNVRSMYKDLVQILQKNELLNYQQLRAKVNRIEIVIYLYRVFFFIFSIFFVYKTLSKDLTLSCHIFFDQKFPANFNKKIPLFFTK